MALPVLTLAQMRDWEKSTWATGQTEAEVIRRVGLALARRALELTRPGDQILILAGKGHNGDDARCTREYLTDRRVDLFEVKDPEADLPKLQSLLSLKPALVLDGMFGIGLNRQLDRAWVEFIEAVNRAKLEVLSVDVPSGLDAGTGQPLGAAIRAALTVTVGAPKSALLVQSAWEYVGRLEVAADVGLARLTKQTELQWSSPEDFAGFPPRRAVASHKGTYGHLAIVAGSAGYHGAAVLAARAAQRAQPGLITLHTMPAVYSVIASQLQAVMVSQWQTGSQLADHRTALLIGPGLAAQDLPPELRSETCRLWQEFEGPLIVDASALAWLPSESAPTPGVRVTTPHPGEAARMLGCQTSEVQADRLQALRELSRRFGSAWVVLKGHQTLIGKSEGPVFVNNSGNPHLAQGGSGDVLSGTLAGLLAQAALQPDPALTLRYGVWHHGAAADALQRSRPNWVVEDLVNELGLTAA